MASVHISGLRPVWRISGLAVAIGCSLWLGAAQAQERATAGAPAASRQTLDIPAQSLRQALLVFSQQTGQNVLLDGNLDASLRSSPVKGLYAADQALAMLLAGTGLSFVRTDASTLSLLPVATGTAMQLGATTISGQALGETTEGTHAYTTGQTATATKLPMSLRETPQSVSVITRQRMDDENLRTLDDVLQSTPGITLIQNGAERSVYMSRGLQVENLQIDGVPTNMGNAYSMDAISKPVTEIYDRIEVVRGASGLLEGAGNPAAAINLVRKRPTAEPQVLVNTSVGSWDDYRTMVDLSSPLNPEGSLRGRTVIAYNNANSYRDTAQKENQLFYGIAELDITPQTLATLGFSYQKERNSGYDWSALPTRADGSFYPMSRSTSLTGDWNKLDKRNTTVFGDIQHYFANDWKLVVAVNQMWSKSEFLGNYSWRVSGDTYSINPRLFSYDDTQTSVDSSLSGPFQLLGRQHDLIVGTNVRKDDFDYRGGRDASYSYVVDMNNLGAFNPPRPSGLNGNMWKYNITQEQAGVYSATRLSLTDSTKLILGSRISWFKTETLNHVSARLKNDYSSNQQITPYAGLVQELDEHHSAYASYTEIFKPQSNLDAGGSPLDPMTGSNYELGLKGEYFDKRLNSALAVFQSDQTGRAVLIEQANACVNGVSACYRAAEKVRSRGIDMELSGALTADWNLSAGYTYTRSKYVAGQAKGDSFATSTPRHLFKLSTDYRLPGDWKQLRVGGSFYAQSRMYQSENDGAYYSEQKAYTLTNLHAAYEINRHLEVQYNLDNVFDKKYYQTLGNSNYWNWFGEPRNFNLALKAKF